MRSTRANNQAFGHPVDKFTRAFLVAHSQISRPNSLGVCEIPPLHRILAPAHAVACREGPDAVQYPATPAIDGCRLPFLPRITGGIKASPAMVEMRPGWQALGYSTTSVERASGQHAKNLLVIVEEASGVADEIRKCFSLFAS